MQSIPNILKINYTLVLIFSVLVMLLSIENSNASVYGVLKGRVLDADGKPAIGASVRVLGTTRGARVKVGGEFTIVNILAGKYEVLITYIGAKEFSDSVSIIANETIDIGEVKLEVTSNIISCGDEIVCCTSIKDNKFTNNRELGNKEELLKIYPNPAVNTSKIDFESQENMITKVVVTNLKTMFSKEIIIIKPNFETRELKRFNTNTFDFSNYDDGEYLISLVYQSESESEVKSSLKFIIDKK